MHRHVLLKGKQYLTVDSSRGDGLVWLASSKRPGLGTALFMETDARRIWREHLADGFEPAPQSYYIDRK
mgnify:CR=1 FL=1